MSAGRSPSRRLVVHARSRRVALAAMAAFVLSAAGGHPALGRDPILVGAGDIAGCAWSADSATARLIEGMGGTVFTSGDNAYDYGTLPTYRACYHPTWGRFKGRTRPAAGNHDAYPSLSGYFDYFGAAAGRRGRGWYRYELGAWQIIVLNSNCGAVGGCSWGSPQVAWLRRVLAEHPAACTLAIWHHPRFSSGPHGDSPKVGHFWRLLYRFGADVVINGHDHLYERFAPQDPEGAVDEATGIRQFIVGTGGAPLYAFRIIEPNSRRRNASTYGVLKLKLHETSYDWRFIRAAGGNFSDSGSASCHGAPGTAPSPEASPAPIPGPSTPPYIHSIPLGPRAE